MFHSIKRLLHWAGGYRKRLYLGCLCSFFSVWCTAIPIVIAAWTLGLVIADFRPEDAGGCRREICDPGPLREKRLL